MQVARDGVLIFLAFDHYSAGSRRQLGEGWLQVSTLLSVKLLLNLLGALLSVYSLAIRLKYLAIYLEEPYRIWQMYSEVQREGCGLPDARLCALSLAEFYAPSLLFSDWLALLMNLLGALLITYCLAFLLRRTYQLWRARRRCPTLTRKETRHAVDLVMTSHELVERILSQLPAPEMCFDTARSCEPYDRWRAAQVNRLFRQTALRLPWAASWRGESGKPSSGDLEILRTPRNVQSVSIFGLDQDTVGQCVFLLRCTRRLDSLHMSCDSEHTLLLWLQHLLVPPTWEAAPAEALPKSRPVLASLSSLSLCVSERPWRDLSWLTALQQLTKVKLSGYAGSPMAGLPHLQTLSVRYSWEQLVEFALEQWASPRLTALALQRCPVSLGYPSSYQMHKTCAEADLPRTWLRRLESLDVRVGIVSPQSAGLRELVPKLTSLNLRTFYSDNSVSLDAVLSKGLPLQLQELYLCHTLGSSPNLLWSAISELSSLVSLTVLEMKGEVLTDNYGVATGCLLSLPQLRTALLNCRDLNRQGLQERVRDVELLLSARGGSFHVGEELD